MSGLAKTSNGGWLCAPQNMNEVYAFAKTIAESTFCPKDMRGRAGDVLAAIQFGSELGMSPMAALQGIAVINGRPSLYGDALMALVLSQPDVIDVVEELDEKTMTASCTVIRQRGARERSITRTFSMADAQKAKLAGKSGPWTDYPKRMLAMRARSWALRDACPDILRGMVAQEEAQDIPQVQATTVVRETPHAAITAHASEPQREESSSGKIAAPVHPSADERFQLYWFKGNKHTGQPIGELSDESLGNYIVRLEKCVAAGGEWGPKAEPYLEAARSEMDERLQREAEPLAADAETDDVPLDEPPAAEPANDASDVQMVEYIDPDGVVRQVPADSLEGQLALSLAAKGIDRTDEAESWGLSDGMPTKANVKRTTRKGAA